MRNCSDIPGVLPVFDAELQPAEGEQPWFVMGLARSISEEIAARSNTLRCVVEAMAAVALTLQEMHARDISHRDVKPENLFFYEERWSVGDFGLVSFEGKTSRTVSGERIGPLHFIAPEMLNTAVQADGKCADVFSLAKTLWVLATGQRFPLPGAYDTTHAPFRIGSYVQAERTGALDKLIESATAFAPDARPSMAQMAEELAAWLAPRPEAKGGISLSTGNFAVELEKRRLSLEADQQRQKRIADRASEVGLRLRESLRPLAKDVDTALRTVNLAQVSLSIDNYHWGFNVSALIPGEGYEGGIISLTVSIDSNSTPEVQMWCRISLRRSAPTAAFEMLLWDKSFSFLEGGSEEELRLTHLRDDVHRELQRCVETALTAVLGRKDVPAAPVAYLVRVVDTDGRPVAGADVLVIGADGVFLRSTTNPDGSVHFGASPLRDVVVFVAHRAYRPAVLTAVQQSSDVVLQSSTSGGSAVCTNGWTKLDGLRGEVELIHEGDNRMFAYGQNLSIDGGAHQPVSIQLGNQTHFRGTDGVSLSLCPVAVIGPCFLVELSVGSQE